MVSRQGATVLFSCSLSPVFALGGWATFPQTQYVLSYKRTAPTKVLRRNGRHTSAVKEKKRSQL